ncbi:MAG: hypothetical protein ACO3JG_13910 [Luteolibacter sp.]
MTNTQQEAAAPEERTTAKATNGNRHSIAKPSVGKAYGTRLAIAEDAARSLIRSWIECGHHTVNHFPPDRFPTRQLAEVAEAVAWASAQGIRGMADTLAEVFADAPDHLRAAFLECTDTFYPPAPEHCGQLVRVLGEFHREKRRREIADRIRQAIEADEEVGGLLAELRDIENESASGSIGDMLAARSFNFEMQPEKPVPIFRLAERPLCTAGNITNIQAPPKAGKSAVVDAMLAAVFAGNRQGPDTLNFSAENPQGLALLHLDTEQSRFDADALVRRAIRRAGIAEPPEWFHSFSLADLGIRERREALRYIMDEAAKVHGGVFAVMVDGIGDLCADPNDSEEAFDLVHEMHALAIRHDCTIATVLHENPGSESGKTRGHLGSQLERKAETNLRLAKDKDGVTTIWAERARHLYLPKEQGPCFAWSDEHRMHVSVGTAGEIRQAANRQKMESEADAAFGGAESMQYADLWHAIGDALDLKERAAKKRVQSWLAAGVIRKDVAGNYRIANP